MGKVNLESSNKLSVLSSSICDIKVDMQDNLKILNNAFAVACESWQDKNAETCAKALEEHNAAMRWAFEKLEDFENALNRLYDLASDYENI